MAVGRDMKGKKNNVISVIGDGAITGGMAYEAMNHAGFLDSNMVIILNDNQQVRIWEGTVAAAAAQAARAVAVVAVQQHQHQTRWLLSTGAKARHGWSIVQSLSSCLGCSMIRSPSTAHASCSLLPPPSCVSHESWRCGCCYLVVSACVTVSPRRCLCPHSTTGATRTQWVRCPAPWPACRPTGPCVSCVRWPRASPSSCLSPSRSAQGEWN